MPRTKKETEQSTVTVKLIKSLNGRKKSHIATAETMGLRKPGDTATQPDNLQTQGKLAHIGYLVEVCK